MTWPVLITVSILKEYLFPVEEGEGDTYIRGSAPILRNYLVTTLNYVIVARVWDYHGLALCSVVALLVL